MLKKKKKQLHTTGPNKRNNRLFSNLVKGMITEKKKMMKLKMVRVSETRTWADHITKSVVIVKFNLTAVCVTVRPPG